MSVLEPSADGLRIRVSTRGGRLLGLDWQGAGGDPVPLLIEAPDGAGPDDRSAFPLVPFGNRLAGNAFRFEGREHTLAPNTPDPFHLHGDGWLGEWSVEARRANAVRLVFRRTEGAYRYAAHQEIGIEEGTVRLALCVANEGDEPMPFGLGWHPFLPRTPQTRLQARVRGFWTERPGHLPGEPAPLPADLDFAAPAPLPERWVNNALEGWDGQARVLWPERGAGLALSADPVFAHAFLFLPDRGVAPEGDWFCFEPMTHLAGGHHLPDHGGLVALAPGQTLAGTLRLTPFSLLSKTDRP